jgi:hypothetical protein
MAGFQVIIYGRFWVFTEGRVRSIDKGSWSSPQPVVSGLWLSG